MSTQGTYDSPWKATFKGITDLYGKRREAYDYQKIWT